MASCDPIESPSGLAWDVIRNRLRALMASQICAGIESVFAGVIVSHGVIPGRGLRFELLEDSLDSILSSDRLVVEEFELGHPPQPQALAELTPEERRGPLQRPRTLALRRCVAHRRVVHPGHLQIRCDLHLGQGQEPHTRIVYLASEQLGKLASNLISDSFGT